MQTIKVKATLVFQIPDGEDFDIRKTDIRWAPKDYQMEEGDDVGIEDLEEIDIRSKTKVHLVVLNGQGDTQIAIVDDAALEYINNGGEPPETLIKSFCDQYDQTEDEARQILREGGLARNMSADNDRAMMVTGTAFGEEKEYYYNMEFDAVGIHRFITKHNLDLDPEAWNGYLY